MLALTREHQDLETKHNTVKEQHETMKEQQTQLQQSHTAIETNLITCRQELAVLQAMSQEISAKITEMANRSFDTLFPQLPQSGGSSYNFIKLQN